MEYDSNFAYRDAAAYLYYANKTLSLKVDEGKMSQQRANDIRSIIGKIDAICKDVEKLDNAADMG